MSSVRTSEQCALTYMQRPRHRVLFEVSENFIPNALHITILLGRSKQHVRYGQLGHTPSDRHLDAGDSNAQDVRPSCVIDYFVHFG